MFLIFLKGSCKCVLCLTVLLHFNVLSLYICILYCVAQINDDDDNDDDQPCVYTNLQAR